MAEGTETKRGMNVDKNELLNQLCSMISYFKDAAEKNEDFDIGGYVIVDKRDVDMLEEAAEMIRRA
jgi:hypothetical protein